MLTVAIGDVHGMAGLLGQLLAAIDRWLRSAGQGKSGIIFLGDYIDRGPDPAAVVARIRALQSAGAVCLRGNHEQLAIDSVKSAYARAVFISNGGDATLQSFGSVASFEDARAWMATLPTYFEDGLRYFVHAGVYPGEPLSEQTDHDRLWIRKPFLEYGGRFEKYVVHGHTPTTKLSPSQTLPHVLMNRCNLDTGAVHGGKLSAAIFDSTKAEPIHTISV